MKVKLMVKESLKELKLSCFLLLFCAGMINAIGVNMFLMPVNLYDSGFSGTSMLLDKLTKLPMAVYIVALNIPFFLYGCKKQGLVFTIYSVFAVIVYSLSSFLITDVLPIEVVGSSPFAGEDLFLCAIFGGLISGIGSGMTIRFGGAIDGVEVMAVVFAKRVGITVGTFVMIYNAALYIVAGALNSSWQLPLYSIVAYSIGVKTIDFIVEGLDKAKSAMIVTRKEKEVCAALSQQFGQGVTIIDAHGFYSDKKTSIVYFVVNRFQIARMKSIVHSVDADAFITISEVSDVLGNSTK